MAASLVIALAGCAWLVFELSSVLKGWATKRWPTVGGVIVSSNLSGSQAFPGGGPFAVSVRYSYKVNGQGFECKRVLHGHDSFDNTYLEAAANKKLRKYAAGEPVIVSYNPEKPSDAVLEPGVKAHTYLYVLVSAGFLAAGAEGVFLALSGK